MPKILPMTAESYRDLMDEVEAVESAYLNAIPYMPPRSPFRPLGDKLMQKDITVIEFTRLRERLCKFWGKSEYQSRFGGAV